MAYIPKNTTFKLSKKIAVFESLKKCVPCSDVMKSLKISKSTIYNIKRMQHTLIGTGIATSINSILLH